MVLARSIIPLVSVSFLLLLWSIRYSAEGKCSPRTELDSRCRKRCTRDGDCVSRKKKIRKCLCDGACGMSCIRVGQRCKQEPTNRLRKGYIKLNEKSYDRNANFRFGDVVRYSCKPGFTLFGPSEVRCSGIGKWKPWDKGTPSCKKSCGDPGSLKDGKRVGKDFEVGNVIHFRCNPGYKIVGSSSITCLASLQWSNKLPRCEVQKCDAPDIPTNAKIHRGKQPFYQYGDRVYVSCVPGYYRRGSGLHVCELGGWVKRGGSKTVCLPKSCGDPGYLINGQKEGTRYTFKNTVKYSCSYGHELSGSAYRRCQANQRWSGELPTCERVDCDIPKRLDNGKYDSYGTKFGDKQYVICNTGYKADGPPEIICGGDRRWSHNTNCRIVTCDASYNKVDHGNVIGSQGGTSCTNTYNCKLEYHCNRGYYLDPSSYRKPICEDNGLWSSSPPKCKPVDCGNPGKPTHGFIASRTPYTYPNTVEYRCNRRYVLQGSIRQRKCQADGTWDESIPYCKASCGNPGRIEHGQVIGNSFMAEDEIEFKCDLGYQLSSDYRRSVCKQKTASWSNPLPKCLPVSCGYPGALYKGTIMGFRYTYKSVLKFRCDPSYDLIGDLETTCQADRSWSRPYPRCQANCGHPGVLEHGRIIGNVLVAGGQVRYECNQGHYLNPDIRSSTCSQESARWWPAVPECQLVSCGNPGDVDKGYIFGSQYTYNSVLKFACNRGYDLIGDDETTCQANGKWTNQNPRCRANCGHPGRLEHGRIIGNVLVADGQVSYECDHGYYLDPDIKSSTCWQESARWWPAVPKCQPVLCGNPGGVENGYIDGSQYTYQSVVQFICNYGYELLGNKTIQCQENGLWTNENPYCQGVLCGELKAPRFGSVQSKDIRHPNSALFTCNTGYKLKGQSRSQCQADGTWSQKEPVCEAIDCGKPQVQDAIFAGTTKFNDIVFITCNKGYKIKGNNMSLCQSNGEWASLPKCEAINCADPPVDHSTFKGVTTVREKVTIICNKGYRLVGNETSECLLSGKWDSLPTCQVTTQTLTATEPPSVRTQALTATEPPSATTSTPTAAQHSPATTQALTATEPPSATTSTPTAAQHSPVTTQALTATEPPSTTSTPTASQHSPDCKDVGGFCQDDEEYCNQPAGSEWGDYMRNECRKTCNYCGGAPTKCDDPGDVAHADKSGEVSVGSQMNYTCLLGYEPNKTFTLTCESNGTWTGNKPVCKAVDCGDPVILNGRYKPLLKNYATQYRSVVEFICDNGFTLSGFNRSSCQANGNWSPKTPICVKEGCDDLPGFKDKCPGWKRFCHSRGFRSYMKKSCTKTCGYCGAPEKTAQ